MEAKQRGNGQEKSGILARLGGKRRLPLLLLAAALGVLLLLFGSTAESAEREAEPDEMTARTQELAAYEAALEAEIAALCDAVGGVSHVKVFVSLDTGYTVRYSTNGDGDPITVGSGSSEQAVYQTVLPPRVSGVGVVCKGGDRAAVREELVELICAALGISSNRVYITGT